MPAFAYFDCFSGISGDMTLAALIDLGADASAIESAIRSMGLPKLSIRVSEVKKCGFRARSISIEHPPEHAHRHLHHINEMIDGATEITPQAKALAKRIFSHVAVAEAKVHGTTLEKVHFHEVGAIDSIADIVGVAVAVDSLQITSAAAAPVPTGTGSIKIDHGLVSVPAPATAEILRGIPLASCSIARELTTPTGAAIIRELCEQFGPLPGMAIDRIGYGAGSMDLPEQANLLRVFLGEPGTSFQAGIGKAMATQESAVVIETNLDDATGEQIADCSLRLLQAGALDVTQTPCTMKKGRSGVILSVIARPEDVSRLETLMFLHSPTIGVRRYPVQRDVLPREHLVVSTSLGDVGAKSSSLPNGATRLKMEHDDLQRLAIEQDMSTESVRRLAETSHESDGGG